MADVFQGIELKNQGPIHYLRLVFPRKGGIMVLHGPNGSGKSNALDGVNQLIARQGKLITRDGTTGAEVTGFGARVALGRRMSRSGTLEVVGLEGFSLAELVEPGVKDQPARDAKRIKALLTLTGAEAKPEMFYEIVGGQEEFDKYVPAEILATDDLVSMQSSIKRALEAASRTASQEATKGFTQAEASRIATEGISIDAPDDSELLSAAFESATRNEASLKAQKDAYEAAAKRTVQAAAALATVKENYTGLPLQQATSQKQLAQTCLDAATNRITELEKLLAEAKQIKGQAQNSFDIAEQVENSARDYEISIRAFEETVNAELPPLVTADQMTQAAEQLRIAKEAVEQGALVRKAKEDLAKAAKLKAKALEDQSQADRLRNAAQSTELVLSTAVASLGVPLKVFDNRLVASNTERTNEVFDDLSEGQQWKLVGSIAVNKVGPGGVIVLPQRAWQDLDQANRRILAEAVESKTEGELGVLVFTAQADSNFDEITPQMFDPFALAE